MDNQINNSNNVDNNIKNHTNNNNIGTPYNKSLENSLQNSFQYQDGFFSGLKSHQQGENLTFSFGQGDALNFNQYKILKESGDKNHMRGHNGFNDSLVSKMLQDKQIHNELNQQFHQRGDYYYQENMKDSQQNNFDNNSINTNMKNQNMYDTLKKCFNKEESLKEYRKLLSQKQSLDDINVNQLIVKSQEQIQLEEQEKRQKIREKVNFKLQDFGSCESLDEQQNSQQNQNEDCCNCKKSKCLKLYCECFRKGKVCGKNCKCNDCHNMESNQQEREQAIEQLQSKNPEAFGNKLEIIGVIQQENNDHLGYKKGCNCYNAGVKCSYLCKCEQCLNRKEEEDNKTDFNNMTLEQLNEFKKIQGENLALAHNKHHHNEETTPVHNEDATTQDELFNQQNIFQDDNLPQDFSPNQQETLSKKQLLDNEGNFTNKYYDSSNCTLSPNTNFIGMYNNNSKNLTPRNKFGDYDFMKIEQQIKHNKGKKSQRIANKLQSKMDSNINRLQKNGYSI
ncbi:hypothetical protein PPERSA_11166 [Pseudocohnilembus persalinus]|uniref:CRC domain-containing protein n=1 Tax=Pseudocohnilembus persalinus TaxID=266149 RepID=A0A0V0QZG9_PSEPJ|nr:hypothetical protein PPERSA_11166 [Pseudocohnilembus persalinus]|eukprot:KRX07617.1 hypothetical protein PPERSA_11166 [Pseudocohnilembus persalinus]